MRIGLKWLKPNSGSLKWGVKRMISRWLRFFFPPKSVGTADSNLAELLAIG